MQKINKELLKGSVAILVLSVLREEPRYGYQIARELRSRSREVFTLGEGTLYPLLHKLQQEGMLESYWKEVGGRRRKYYAITGQGRQALTAKAAEWRVFSQAMDHVM